jgi:hypothetical protein
MALTLIAVANRENVVDLTYEETVGDPQPFILTVTSHHVANQSSKLLPISASDLQAYVLKHETKLRETAEKCKAQGLKSEVL